MVFQYIMLIFVFFFKQKTAYEMRISDWSSDVCSSDLHSAAHREPDCPVVAGRQVRAQGCGACRLARRRVRVRTDTAVIGQPWRFPREVQQGGKEIGRASCRE